VASREGAHFNGILSCEFDTFNSFVFASCGMDYSIKYWDTRNLSLPISGIFDNSHWIWDIKHNKQFPRLLISSSSSAVVRAHIFEKEHEDSGVTNLFHRFSSIDYTEFDDCVYSLDWSLNDPWTFVAVSYNAYLYVNSIPEDIKYKIMLDN
jgi:WD40 repeat protein